jgi:GTPase KRas protein
MDQVILATFSAWSTADQHREGNGFVLVYSITSRQSFERIEDYRRQIMHVKGNAPVCILVGNKCDEVSNREVSREEGAELARRLGWQFLEASAKTAVNVEEIFATAVRLLRLQLDAKPPRRMRNRDVRSAMIKRMRCVIM